MGKRGWRRWRGGRADFPIWRVPPDTGLARSRLSRLAPARPSAGGRA